MVPRAGSRGTHNETTCKVNARAWPDVGMAVAGNNRCDRADPSTPALHKRTCLNIPTPSDREYTSSITPDNNTQLLGSALYRLP